MKNSIIKKISRRFIVYISLFIILLTFGSIMIPQLAAGILIKVSLMMPVKKLMISSNPSLCEEAQLKVENLPPRQKEQLAKEATLTLKSWPQLISQQHDQNKIINLTSHVLTAFDIGKNDGLKGAQRCFLLTLRSLKQYSSLYLQDLVKLKTQLSEQEMYEIDNLIISVLSENKEAADVLKEIILKETDLKRLNTLWAYFHQIGPIAVPALITIFDQSELGGAKEQEAIRFFPSIMNQSAELSVDIKQYILDKNKPVQKRVALLGLLTQSYVYREIEDDFYENILNDPSAEIRNALVGTTVNWNIKTQKKLDLYLKLHQPLFDDFNLSKREDWKKIDLISKLVTDLNYKVSRHFAAPKSIDSVDLDLTKLTSSLQNVLKIIVQQVGYQSESFIKLSGIISQTHFAEQFSPFYDKLLTQKNERQTAINFFSRLKKIPKTTATLLAKQLLKVSDDEKISILGVFTTLSAANGEARELYDEQLRDIFFSMLGHKNNSLNAHVYYLILKEGESALPDIRKRLKYAKKNTSYYLSLLRLQWHLSSTAKSNQELEAELKKYKQCDFTFASAFSEFITKSADSPPSTDNIVRGANLGASVYLFFQKNVAPVSKVQVAPSAQLFEKFLSCDTQYIPQLTIFHIVQFDPKLKSVVEEQAVKSLDPKKSYLLKALDKKALYQELDMFDGDI